MLTHWARDRRHDRLPLEFVVKKQTSDTAHLFGLLDRGVIAPGYRADINLIDHAGLALEAPIMVHDLPAGGSRFIQRARGYRATLVAGEVVRENGEDTGALPGRLIRGARPSPTSAN
jgi:N-acyl-D-aspartate/D-glutamate deacylase